MTRLRAEKMREFAENYAQSKFNTEDDDSSIAFATLSHKNKSLHVTVRNHIIGIKFSNIKRFEKAFIEKKLGKDASSTCDDMTCTKYQDGSTTINIDFYPSGDVTIKSFSAVKLNKAQSEEKLMVDISLAVDAIVNALNRSSVNLQKSLRLYQGFPENEVNLPKSIAKCNHLRII